MMSESNEAMDSTSEEEVDAMSMSVGELERVALVEMFLADVAMQNIIKIMQDRLDDKKMKK